MHVDLIWNPFLFLCCFFNSKLNYSGRTWGFELVVGLRRSLIGSLKNYVRASTTTVEMASS